MSENLSERFAELPSNLSSHLQLTMVALLVGVLISLPLAILLVRRPRWRYPVLTIASVIQTIPGLALLALMVPFLVLLDEWGIGIPAFGFAPAVIALTLYSVLPILRNTTTGLLGVDATLTEAARGMGMSDKQILFTVEFPLAAPVILAGIRTAAVWTVGTATLATPIGQTCLGNYIFAGLQTRNWVMVMFGVLSAAALAMLLDALLGLLEKAAAHRRPALAAYALAGLSVLVITGVAAPSLARVFEEPPRKASTTLGDVIYEDTSPVRIGAKTFTEQYILAQLIDLKLETAGLASQTVDSLGSAVVFDALVNGDIDVYVDYSGTIWANYMKRSEVRPAWRVLTEVEAWLAVDKSIRSLGTLGFENTYALAMRRAHADKLGVKTISELATHASKLSIAGDYEFFGRKEWKALTKGYGFRFAEKTSFDPSLMYSALANGDVDAAAVFSSDGRIAAFDLLVLKDDRGAIPPYDAMLLLSAKAAKRQKVVDALRPLIGSIPIDAMRQANQSVDRDQNKLTTKQAARQLLGDKLPATK